MEHRNLGRTGLKVSPLCLGTMNFGPQTSEADSFAIMDRALAEGVNFFDTANVYGEKQGEGITEKLLAAGWPKGAGEGNLPKTCCYCLRPITIGMPAPLC